MTTGFKDHLLREQVKLPYEFQERGFLSHKDFIFSLPTAGLVETIFPISSQFQNYHLKHFFSDLRSAITIAFVVLPSSIAFASLAGVKPMQAILTAIFSPIIYGLIGSSPHLAVGPEVLGSALVGIVVTRELEIDPTNDPGMVAGGLALTCGIISIILGLFQAGFIDSLLSGYLLIGFVLGVTVLIMIQQLPNLLGLPIETGLASASAVEKLITYCKLLPQASLNTFYMSLASLAFLFTMTLLKQRFASKYRWIQTIPDVLILMILAIVISYTADIKQYGISTIGQIDRNIPPPRIPKFDFEFFSRYLTLGTTIVIVGFFESQTVIREFGLAYNYFPSGDRVLFALGTVNLLTGFLNGFPAFGSLPRSKTQAAGGAKTLLAGIMAGILVLIIFLTAGSLVKHLPRNTLGSIVFVAAYKLIEFKQIHFVFKMGQYSELFKMFLTFFFTVYFSVASGILFCLLFSALIIIRKNTKVSLCLMGEVVENEVFKLVDLHEHHDAKLLPGVVILAFKGSVEYFNASKIARKAEMLIDTVMRYQNLTDREHSKLSFDGSIENPRLFFRSKYPHGRLTLILDFSLNDDMDSSAVWELFLLLKKFQKEGNRVIFCGIVPFQYKMFNHAGLLKALGSENIFDTVLDALKNLNSEDSLETEIFEV